MADITEHPRYPLLNTLVNALITKIELAQADYFVEHSMYFQGIQVPDLQLNGTTDETVNWSVKPFYQDESYKDFDPTTFQQQFKIPFQIRIDQYVAPNGSGWILTIDLFIEGLGPDIYGFEGDHWAYRHNVGPKLPVHPPVWDVWHVVTE
jgi:hypothetical protein